MSYPVDKTFSILLALASGPATGSEIGQQVSADTLAANYLQKSSLYLLLKRLAKEGLIVRVEPTQISTSQTYHLTRKGWKVLERSVSQLDNQLQFVRSRLDEKRYN